MRIPLVFVAVAVSVLVSACGGAAPGDKCSTTGLLCNDESSALECRLGAWRALPCRGPNGCSVVNDKITCDLTGNLEGDACAASTEGKGLCDPSGTAALTCRSGTLVKTNTCSSCAVVGEQVQCNDADDAE